MSVHIQAQHPLSGIDRGARISGCGTYRYHLWRYWDMTKPALVFIMLNPSTADATIDDRTIGRCIKFAERFGYGGIDVVNLYAFRATNPVELKSTPDPVGPNNDQWVRHVVFNAIENDVPVVCAWGTLGGEQGKLMLMKLDMVGAKIKALAVTQDGHPRHPLYLPNSAELIDFPVAA